MHELGYGYKFFLNQITLYGVVMSIMNNKTEGRLYCYLLKKNGELNYYCYYNNGIKHNDDGYAEFILLKDKNMMYRKIINGEIKNKKLIKFSLSF